MVGGVTYVQHSAQQIHRVDWFRRNPQPKHRLMLSSSLTGVTRGVVVSHHHRQLGTLEKLPLAPCRQVKLLRVAFRWPDLTTWSRRATVSIHRKSGNSYCLIRLLIHFHYGIRLSLTG